MCSSSRARPPAPQQQHKKTMFKLMCVVRSARVRRVCPRVRCVSLLRWYDNGQQQHSLRARQRGRARSARCSTGAPAVHCMKTAKPCVYAPVVRNVSSSDASLPEAPLRRWLSPTLPPSPIAWVCSPSESWAASASGSTGASCMCARPGAPPRALPSALHATARGKAKGQGARCVQQPQQRGHRRGARQGEGCG